MLTTGNLGVEGKPIKPRVQLSGSLLCHFIMASSWGDVEYRESFGNEKKGLETHGKEQAKLSGPCGSTSLEALEGLGGSDVGVWEVQFSTCRV